MPLLTPGEGWLPACCACLTCFIGAYSTLLLASANLRLRNVRLTVLTALLFGVQCFFSLHFIAMSGITLGQPWGFDVVLTLFSFALAACFTTAGVFLAQVIRQRMQDRLQASFAGCDFEETPVGPWLRVARTALGRASPWKLIMAVVLMATGACGCHHVGMWSMRGYPGALVAVRLTLFSLPVTLFLGGLASVLTVLAFLLLPCGAMRWVAAVVLTGAIAAWHWTSAVWGMEYVAGDEFVSFGPIIGQESILVLVVAQGTLSQAISNAFSRMTIAAHREDQRQLQAAKAITKHITLMELEPVKALEAATPSPSALEKALFQVVAKLELYRPYLPDTLFISDKSDREDGTTVGGTSADPGETAGETGLGPSLPPPATLDSLVLLGPVAEAETPADAAPAQNPKSPLRNMALGLTHSRITMLRVALRDLHFRHGPDLNLQEVQDTLAAFLLLAVTQVKGHRGTVTSCSNGVVTAMWHSRSPLAGLRCAMAIQEGAVWPLVQLVQSGPFLVGNLAAEQLSCFNTVGPLDLPGQQLLRLEWPADLVLITAAEKEAAELQYHCLPVEHVLAAGAPTTVFAVFPLTGPRLPETEWMYEIARHQQQSPAAHAQACWAAYVSGQYSRARDLARQLRAVPEWYAAHLLSLVEAAVASPGPEPVRNLRTAGWVRPAGPTRQRSTSPSLLCDAAVSDEHGSSSMSAFTYLTGADPGAKLGQSAFRGVRRHTGHSAYLGTVSTDLATSHDGAPGTLELPSRAQSDVNSAVSVSLPNVVEEAAPNPPCPGRGGDLEKRFLGVAIDPAGPAIVDSPALPSEHPRPANRGFFRRLNATVSQGPEKGKGDSADASRLPAPPGPASAPASPNALQLDLAAEPRRPPPPAGPPPPGRR